MLEKLFFVLKYVTCNRLSCDITIVTKTMHYLKVSSEEESDMWLNVLGKCVSKEEVLLLKHITSLVYCTCFHFNSCLSVLKCDV